MRVAEKAFVDTHQTDFGATTNEIKTVSYRFKEIAFNP